MAASQVRVIAACLLTSLPGFGADIPVLSVCDVLQHLSAYRGKTVVVVGHTFDSFEGGILSGGCGGRKSVGIGGKQWPVAIFELGNRIPSKAGAFPVPLPELLAKKEA